MNLVLWKEQTLRSKDEWTKYLSCQSRKRWTFYTSWVYQESEGSIPAKNKTHCMPTFRCIHPCFTLFTRGTRITRANGANFVVNRLKTRVHTLKSHYSIQTCLHSLIFGWYRKRILTIANFWDMLSFFRGLLHLWKQSLIACFSELPLRNLLKIQLKDASQNGNCSATNSPYPPYKCRGILQSFLLQSKSLMWNTLYKHMARMMWQILTLQKNFLLQKKTLLLLPILQILLWLCHNTTYCTKCDIRLACNKNNILCSICNIKQSIVLVKPQFEWALSLNQDLNQKLSALIYIHSTQICDFGDPEVFPSMLCIKIYC